VRGDLPRFRDAPIKRNSIPDYHIIGWGARGTAVPKPSVNPFCADLRNPQSREVGMRGALCQCVCQMTAESRAADKDAVVKVIVNLINQDNP
jgi:hypothetical protein